MIKEAIDQVRAGQDLGMDEMQAVITRIMDGECEQPEIIALLTALHDKGEAVTEVAGAAAAMRAKMTRIACPHKRFIDVVGTGGDASSTFNISTAAAIVTAAAGVPVAKHGNRGYTSKSGSADVLSRLGVNIEADLPTVERCLAELGLCFCFAPLFHQAMRHVGPARQQISTPTIFNILGPLVNPAGAPFQLLGVGRARQQPLLAEAIKLLGAKRVCVVHGTDGLDEVTLAAPTTVMETRGGEIRSFEWTPADFGLPGHSREGMIVDSPEASAVIIRGILTGEQGPCRDIVVANAAAAIWTVEENADLRDCTMQAAEAIDSGVALDLINRLADMTHGEK